MSKKSKRERKKRFPNKILALKNADKKFMESWSSDRSMLNFPHSFRMLCLGPPNVGKSTIVKNIVVRADPKFKQIFLIHCDPDGTLEYDDLDVEILDDIPEPYDGMFDRDIKSLLIIDDMEFQYMSKTERRRLDRLFGYTSTHRGLSICVCAQDMFNLIPCIRRMSNIIVLWKVMDLDLMNTIGRRVGLKKGEFHDLCLRKIRDVHDSIWIDLTKGSPYPLRFNGFEKICLKGEQILEDKENVAEINKLGANRIHSGESSNKLQVPIENKPEQSGTVRATTSFHN